MKTYKTASGSYNEDELAIVVWRNPDSRKSSQARFLETMTSEDSEFPMAFPIKSLTSKKGVGACSPCIFYAVGCRLHSHLYSNGAHDYPPPHRPRNFWLGHFLRPLGVHHVKRVDVFPAIIRLAPPQSLADFTSLTDARRAPQGTKVS